MSTKALMTSRTDDWLTPPEVLEALAPLGPIALDPCAHPQGLVPAGVKWPGEGPLDYCPFCDKEGCLADAGVHECGTALICCHDGLARPWYWEGMPPGYVFCNPPYGRALATWAGKVAIAAARGQEVVVLVPARTDTAWWATMAPRTWCAWRGRLRFWAPGTTQAAPGGTAPFPAALLYFGRRAHLFADSLAAHGQIYWRVG